MPVRYLRDIARLEGVCAVEDAESLLEWLHEHPDGKLNFKDCEHLHSAVLQVIMAMQPCVAACPRAGTPIAAVMDALFDDADTD